MRSETEKNKRIEAIKKDIDKSLQQQEWLKAKESRLSKAEKQRV